MQISDALKNFHEQEEYINGFIEQQIEKNRKGNAEIRFNAKDLHELPKKIHVKQISHEFKFGANLFMLDEFDDEIKNEKYKYYFSKVFNLATLPFYWNGNEPEQGNKRYEIGSPRLYRRPAIDLCLDFCKKNDIEPKAHCLVYEFSTPDWVRHQSNDDVKRLLEMRFEELSRRYREEIPCWEVINETLCVMPENSSGLFYEDDIIEMSFKKAREYFPKNKLMINESQHYIFNVFRENRSQYYMLIERALRNKSEIDSIGMQFHMWCSEQKEYHKTISDFYNPEHLYRVLDRYSDFGLPIQITEMTLPHYNDDSESEKIQEEILKNIYKIFFAHPSMEGIVYWNLPDGYAAGAVQGDMTNGENKYRGGLLRFDLSPKPAYEMLDKLVNKEWNTECDVFSDNGKFCFRGFYGKYLICYENSIGDVIEKEIFVKKNNINNFIFEI